MSKLGRYLQEQDRIIREDREKTLIALGLTEKEYGDSRQHTQWDYINGEKRYYREIAIEVTDEEYALILSKTRQVEEIQQRDKEKRKAALHAPHVPIKKWIPVFAKKRNAGLFGDDNEPPVETG